MRHQWQTGRQYSAEGQRIVAETVEGGVIFRDIDRNVEGFILMVPPTRPDVLQYRVMVAYDACDYSIGSVELYQQARSLKWET